MEVRVGLESASAGTALVLEPESVPVQWDRSVQFASNCLSLTDAMLDLKGKNIMIYHKRFDEITEIYSCIQLLDR